MVRFGKMSDFDDVMIVLNHCKEDMKERNLNIWNETYPNADIIRKDLGTGKSVVYELDGKVIAFLAMYPGKDEGFEEIYHDHGNFVLVQRVMVEPVYRRQGYAQEILHFVEKQGFSSIRLLTRNTNVYSVNLYTKLGYVCVRKYEHGNAIMQNCEKILVK